VPALEIRVPGDKSIAHRALILGALAEGESVIDQVPTGKDVLATEACLRALGVAVVRTDVRVHVRGGGLAAWRTAGMPLDCQNSGTTMRLLTGVLAASGVTASLTGDASLCRRPKKWSTPATAAIRARGNASRSSAAVPN